MTLIPTKSNANLLTNWFGGIAGLPQLISGLGLANVSLVQVNDGYHLALTWMPNSFSPEQILTGVAIIVYGYIHGKSGR
jgi:hypothetical protein